MQQRSFMTEEGCLCQRHHVLVPKLRDVPSTQTSIPALPNIDNYLRFGFRPFTQNSEIEWRHNFVEHLMNWVQIYSAGYVLFVQISILFCLYNCFVCLYSSCYIIWDVMFSTWPGLQFLQFQCDFSWLNYGKIKTCSVKGAKVRLFGIPWHHLHYF